MYRAEFFSYDVQYKDFALFDDDTELSLDYIAWDASQIKIPGKRLAVIKGDLVHITRDGKTAFDGYVNNVSYPSKNVTQVDVLPLLCSIRFSAGFDAHYLLTTDLALDLHNMIYDRYVAGVEPYQTPTEPYPDDDLLMIPFAADPSLPAKSRPYGASDEFKSATCMELISYLLTVYQVTSEAYIDLDKMQVHFAMRESADTIVIEADADNIVERNITLGNSYGSVNKMIIYKLSDTIPRLATAYYLHKDGSVDTDGSDFNTRILPVVSAAAIVTDSETWDDEALQKAKDTMQPKAFDNEIELTVKSDDKLLTPKDIKIGTLATVRSGGVEYQSLLTGKVLQNNLIKLIFGCVRVDLTKQLLMERGRI